MPGALFENVGSQVTDVPTDEKSEPRTQPWQGADRTLMVVRIRRIHMGTKTVRLDEDVYERIKAKKRDDETFSEAIERLTGDYSLLDFAGGMSGEEAETVRKRIDDANEEYADGLAEQFGE